jgi:hypothetical protein
MLKLGKRFKFRISCDFRSRFGSCALFVLPTVSATMVVKGVDIYMSTTAVLPTNDGCVDVAIFPFIGLALTLYQQKFGLTQAKASAVNRYLLPMVQTSNLNSHSNIYF